MSDSQTASVLPLLTVCSSSLGELAHAADVPLYNREALIPSVVHIGVGAFHRSHQAYYFDRYFRETADLNWGIFGAGVLTHDRIMQKAMASQDYLYCLLEKGESGDKLRVIGSHVGMVVAPDAQKEFIERLASPVTKLVTLTITEGGYKMNLGTGEFLRDDIDIQHDIDNPESPRSVFGYLAAGLMHRKERGIEPFTILSCDNLQENGRVCRRAMLSFCELLDPSLGEWLSLRGAFPSSMVDRITPATTDDDKAHLESCYGVIDHCPVVAEPFCQWVIEDSFSLGRPDLEKVGVQFTDDVAPFEKMKLRLLNASHSAMGYLGYLLNFEYIFQVAQDERFRRLLAHYMTHEALPTLDPVPGIDVGEYCETLIERFRNPAIKDHVLRICKDGSAKIPRFILPVVVDAIYEKRQCPVAALVVASWWNFLIVDDANGGSSHIDDPMTEQLRSAAIGGIERFLDQEDIFGALVNEQNFRSSASKWAQVIRDKGAGVALDMFLSQI
jgi:mannitol 2-dehydrogenase